jgi:hypothetical protein
MLVSHSNLIGLTMIRLCLSQVGEEGLGVSSKWLQVGKNLASFTTICPTAQKMSEPKVIL